MAQSLVADNGITVETSEYVDLGLESNTLWASCNIGAQRPEQCGGYYAWGELTQKRTYRWTNYFDNTGLLTDDDEANDNCSTIEKFNRYRLNGTLSIINTPEDIARIAWGKGWQMPSAKQLNELLFNCEWKWTQLNGMNGFTVTGPNKKSIFMPAAGCCYYSPDSDELHNYGETCFYWSGDLDQRESFEGERALCLIYSKDYPKFDDRDGNRSDGKSIRPVYVKY